MSEGIQTVESLSIHLVDVVAKLVKLMKDGVDLSDFVVLAADEELKALVADIMSYKQVVAETKDLDLTEGLQLAVAVVPKIIEAIKA